MKNKQKERFRDKRTGTSGAYIPVPCHMHVLLQDTAGHAVCFGYATPVQSQETRFKEKRHIL